MLEGKALPDPHDGAKQVTHRKEFDMMLRVLAVKAAVGGKFPLAVFDNIFFSEYIFTLDPKTPPSISS